MFEVKLTFYSRLNTEGIQIDYPRHNIGIPLLLVKTLHSVLVSTFYLVSDLHS